MPPEISRRSLARGAAWTAPVVVAGVAAPAYAVSNLPCPAIPPGTSWTTTVTGTLANTSDPAGWQGATLVVRRDNGVITSVARISTSVTLSTITGVLYNLNVPISWARDDVGGTLGTRTRVTVLAGATTLLNRQTNTTGTGGLGTTPGSATYAVSFTAAASTTVLAIQVELPTTLVGNDDVTVGPLAFTSCTR